MSLWTEEQVNELKRLASNKNLSIGDIAREMRITLNAVIGKIHRLGLHKSIPERAARSGLVGRRNGGQISAQKRRASTHSDAAAASNIVRGAIAKRRASVVTSFAATAKTPARFVARSSGEAVAPCGLLDLKSDSCRWPFGDPRDQDFYFCGGKVIGCGPYCGDHAALAFN